MDYRAGAPGAVWRTWLRRSVTTLIALMAAYIGLAWWAARGDLVAAIRKFPLTSLPLVIGLVSCGIILRTVRWHFYVRRLAWHVPLGHSVLVFLASFAFTATPGKAGEAVKSVLLRMSHQVPLSAGVGVLLVERLGDLIAVLLLAVAGLGLTTGAGSYLLLTAVPIAMVMIFVSSRAIHDPVLARIARFKRLAGLADRLARSLDACRQILRPIPFLVGLALALTAWSCEAVAFHQLMQGAGIEIGALQAVSVYAAATLAGAISALPGGVGGFEVTMVLLLKRLGVPVAAAMAPVAVFRLCTLWFGILLGMIFLLVWMFFVSPGAPLQFPASSEDKK